MKTNKLKIMCLAFGIVFLSSCSNLLFTSLDILRPAKIAFAPEAKNLLIVNNTITQPINIGHKSQLLNEKEKNVLLVTDSLSIFCLGALKEELDVKDFFTTIQFIPNSKNTGSDFNKVYNINTDSLKELFKVYHVDAVLSLDKIKVNDDLSEFYINENSSYLSTLEVKFETFWSIHYPQKPEINTIQFKDTVYWESTSYYRRKAMSDLPYRSDALIDGALNVGQKSVNRFVPYWDKEDRYFFNPSNKLMRKGIDSVYVKNWKAAIGYWDDALKKAKSQWLKAQAANNIAISYEILGDLDKAIEFASLSYYTMGKLTFVDYQTFNRISEYINALTQRKNDVVILKKQLGE